MDDNNTEDTVKETHNKYTDAYVSILDTYRNQIDSSVTKKNELKEKFFNAIKCIMYILTVLFVVTLVGSYFLFNQMIKNDYQSVSVITGAISAIISSFVTMVLSIFKLPEIIADYLFNKEEDQLMNTIIKNIQQYEIDAVKYEIEKTKLERVKQLNEETTIISEGNIDTELINSSYDPSPSDSTDIGEQYIDTNEQTINNDNIL